MKYPVVVISPALLAGFASEDELRGVLGMTTPAGERSGYWSNAVVVDIELSQFQIVEVELSPRRGLFRWMRQPRRVEHFRVRRVGALTLNETREQMEAAMVANTFWGDLEREEMLQKIANAQTRQELFETLMLGQR